MWTDGTGFFYEGDCRPGDRKATAGEATAWRASLPPVEDRRDFEHAMRRLTDAEWSALQAACAANVQLARWYERAKTRGSIDLNDTEVGSALDAVVAAKLFTRERLAELFAP